jgi:competence protein ComGC
MSQIPSSKFQEKGLTFIEALVVIFIVVILASIAIANFPEGRKQLKLQRAAHKLVQDLREVQEMATSAKEYECLMGLYLKGYGINFIDEADFYSLRARCENGSYQDFEVKSIDFEEGVEIKELKKDNSSVASVDIFFYPPSPETDLEGANEIKITISIDTSQKVIKVNKAGLIEIE